MTELEKIKRAKMYMDKLARGIDPIDDTMAHRDRKEKGISVEERTGKKAPIRWSFTTVLRSNLS